MRPLSAVAALAAALVLAAPAAADGTFQIDGGGFGHGIGMSQYGAYGYAQHGKSYRFILGHYYQGTRLGQANPLRIVRVLLASGPASFSGATYAPHKRLNPNRTYSVQANADGTHATDWPANLDSFKRVVALANEAGPTIVIAYQSTTFAKANPTLWMSRFADVLQDLIVSIRNLRAELKVEPKVKVPIEVFFHEPETATLIFQNRTAVEQLANVSEITEVDQAIARQAPTRGSARFDVHVIYEKKVDAAAECERLKKELEKIEKETGNNQRQLSNEQFLAKAPAQVVEGMRRRAAELVVLWDKTISQMKELDCK